jgi:hypothetical protein
MSDELNRPDIATPIKDAIARAFTAVPEGKRGAFLVVADEKGTRVHLAAKFGDSWKVAGGGGWAYGTKRPSGYVAVEASW